MTSDNHASLNAEQMDQLVQALTLQKAGRLGDAITLFSSLPPLGEVALYFGLALGQTGDHAGALTQLSTYLSKAEFSREAYAHAAYLEAAKLSAYTGDWGRALSYYESLLNISLNHEVALLHWLNVAPRAFVWQGMEQVLERIGEICWTPSLLNELDHALLMLHHVGASKDLIARLHREWGKLVAQMIPPRPRPSLSLGVTAERKIRIGYLSPDFREHSMGCFLKPILDLHDAESFEVFCYSLVEYGDAWAESFASHKGFRQLSNLSVQDANQVIVDDKIDILIDCAGHTGGNGLMIMACRPAPIQMTAFGYPNTTGLAAIDYRLTDKVVDDEATKQWHSEALCRVDEGCFLPFPILLQKDQNPEVLSRESLGLSEDAFVLGSFNHMVKLNPQLLAQWAKILQASDNTQLLISGVMLGSEVAQRILAIFGAYQVDASRVILRARADSVLEMRGRMACCDLMLDSAPYAGTTTTFEALAAKVPVVTLCGTTHVERTSASILSYMGLDELVCADWNSYCHQVKTYVLEPEKYAALCAKLGAALITVDNADYVRRFETLLTNLWTKHRQVL